MKRILITGMAGSVGSELARQLYKSNKIYGLDTNESDLFMLMNELEVPGRVGDVRDEQTIRDVFADFKPEIIYHAAALKHVGQGEYVPLEYIKTNVLGTYNVIHHAKINQIKKMVCISTDKVVNATSIMGQTKKLAETMTVNSGYTAVRFGNVLGSRGSLLEIWERQINEGKPITVTDGRMERFLMTIQEAVALVIKAGEIGRGGEIICFDMKKPVKILELATKLAKELRGDVKIIGIRPGEQLEEHLMTEEEKKKAVKRGDFYVL